MWNWVSPPLLLRTLQYGHVLPLLQHYFDQSTLRRPCINIYRERLTQLLAPKFFTSSVCWWIWNQARWFYSVDVYLWSSNWSLRSCLHIKLQTFMSTVGIDIELLFIIYRRSSLGFSVWSICAGKNLPNLLQPHPSYI